MSIIASWFRYVHLLDGSAPGRRDHLAPGQSSRNCYSGVSDKRRPYGPMIIYCPSTYRALEREVDERRRAEAKVFAMELRRKEMAAQVRNKVRNVSTRCAFLWGDGVRVECPSFWWYELYLTHMHFDVADLFLLSLVPGAVLID